MYATQCIDTFIDNTTHDPVEHKTEADARRYASELSGRRRCEVKLAVGNRIVDTYVDGKAVKAATVN